MRFDRFVSLLAVAHYSEAVKALFGPEGNYRSPLCNFQLCNPGNPCPHGCRCSSRRCR